MTISDAIKKMNDLADIGIVNAKEDAKALRETAKILYRLREKLDPRWNEWLIVDEGQFLAAFHDGESEWRSGSRTLTGTSWRRSTGRCGAWTWRSWRMSITI